VTEPLRVAFNATALLSPLTGVGQYAKSLAEALAASGELDLHFFYAASWTKEIRTTPVKYIGPIKQWIRKFVPHPYLVGRALQTWRFGIGIKKLRPQVYHEPNFIPFPFKGPTVVTVHDLSWIRFPETHPRERVAAMNEFFPASLKRSHHIITDAEFVRREVIEEFDIPPERITAIPLAARAIFAPRAAEECEAVLRRFNLDYRRYTLCVGTMEPRKNLELAIRAFAMLPAAFRRRQPLVLVGMKGWLTSRVETMMQPLVAAGDIRSVGFATDEELAVLYAAAKVLVYPSLYEGFGLPPLEAMASGTPVIVSDRSTLPEVVGSAGILIHAEDISGLQQALLRFEEDSAYWNEKTAACLAQAARFSWQRCARETLAIYRKVYAER
jgi:glycosyltransferase involved in cell wall biosynthesis